MPRFLSQIPVFRGLEWFYGRSRELSTGKVLVVPHSYTKRLENATEEQIREYRLVGNGRGIHFPLIDEDISVEGIIRDFGNEVKRVNISLPVLFLDELDSYAKEHQTLTYFVRGQFMG